jgi:hypothetical protein
VSLSGTYTRRPKKVEAVLITHDNAIEVAEWLGCREVKLDRRPTYIFIWPDGYDQPAWVGYWYVKMDGHVRLMNSHQFRDEFEPELPEEEDETDAKLFEWPDYDR